jgi:hypothetical protein
MERALGAAAAGDGTQRRSPAGTTAQLPRLGAAHVSEVLGHRF